MHPYTCPVALAATTAARNHRTVMHHTNVVHAAQHTLLHTGKIQDARIVIPSQLMIHTAEPYSYERWVISCYARLLQPQPMHCMLPAWPDVVADKEQQQGQQ